MTRSGITLVLREFGVYNDLWSWHYEYRGEIVHNGGTAPTMDEAYATARTVREVTQAFVEQHNMKWLE